METPLARSISPRNSPASDGGLGAQWTVMVYLWKERKGLWWDCNLGAKSQSIIGPDIFHMYQQKQLCFHGDESNPFLWSYFPFVCISQVSTGFIILQSKQTYKRTNQKLGIWKDLMEKISFFIISMADKYAVFLSLFFFFPFLNQNKVKLLCHNFGEIIFLGCMSALYGPVDYSLPISSVHGIFQARILDWVAISSSRRSSWPRDWMQIVYYWATRKVHILGEVKADKS